ncbi:Protein F37C4.5 [Leucoagaricus sp. SymC.cos]|nr:Protein F37C4.5 [Leucoagaricus sp. SymC.cos]
MAESKEVLPPFAPTTIDLVSVKDGKVTHVSLYSSRAEITRAFRFEAKVGLNQVNINGLPNTLDTNSLKVEGTGHATIHDVTISDLPLPEKPTTSDKLDDLLHKKKKTDQAIDRCSLAIKSLETYLGTLNVKDVGVAEVANIVKTYQATGEGLDNQITGLRDELEKLESDIKIERKNLENPAENQELRKRASVGLFADTEGEVGIKLIYAVHQAHWEAFYDIRVNMHNQDKPVELTYKASISQSTGEGWNDVDLTLETANPTFGVNIPRLAPWTISSYRPVPVKFMKSKGLARASVAMPMTSALLGGDAAAPHGYKYQEPEPEMSQMEARVNSRGNITATFGVPGKISIPSDGATHSVTIVKLNLDAQMRWVVVPKFEAKTHLSAKIKNASEFTLLSGEASIYVDGSFIARTKLPLVSPEENFDCPLGLDPSIRITYHPRNKKTTRTGFYNKSITHVYTQRVTVANTKTSAVDDLKVTDQFPVSEDSTITVKRISPALVDVLKETSSGEIKIPDKLKVSSGVFAQWNGADEPDVNVESLGAEGKFDWVCAIPSQGKMDLVLQYEITAPSNTQISGL